MTQWDKWINMWRGIGLAYKLDFDLHYNVQLRTAQLHDRFFQEARNRMYEAPEVEVTFNGIKIRGFAPDFIQVDDVETVPIGRYPGTQATVTEWVISTTEKDPRES